METAAAAAAAAAARSIVILLIVTAANYYSSSSPAGPHMDALVFQNLISEEEVVAEAEAVDVAAPDICRRSYWMDTRYTSPYAAPTKNANANDE